MCETELQNSKYQEAAAFFINSIALSLKYLHIQKVSSTQKRRTYDNVATVKKMFENVFGTSHLTTYGSIKVTMLLKKENILR